MVEDCRIRPRVYKIRNGVPKAESFVINLEYVFFFVPWQRWGRVSELRESSGKDTVCEREREEEEEEGTGERPGLGCMKRRGLGWGRDRFQVEEVLVGFNIVIETNVGLSEIP